MSFSTYQYAIALGADVALNNLLNIQQMLFPYNYVTSNEGRAQIAPVSDPPDFAPVRIQTLDSQESRDGITYAALDMYLTSPALNFWLNFFWPAAVASVTGSISTLVTFNTRQTQFGTYTRQNCYIIYPTIANKTNTQGDLSYLHKRGVWLLHQRFNDLVSSA